MKIINSVDFFKKPITEQTEPSVKEVILANDGSGKNSGIKKITKPHTSGAVAMLVKETAQILEKCGLSMMSRQVERVLQDAAKERFLVSVVGEFSRGKSTFLNNLFDGATALPTGNLPTTAVMTRIRYANQPKMAVFDNQGTRVSMLDVKPESWDGLVANNFGEQQPQGSVIIGVPDHWLGRNCIEMVDCPGAGDLSEERTKQIADALKRTDGAVICISATSPLSMTEREFILQRILKRKTPFSMIVVTKLDLVDKRERNGIIKLIENTLKLNKMDIPIYIPTNVEMSDDSYGNIIGLDKIKTAVENWANDPRRQVLTDIWIKSRVLDIVYMAIDTLKEQQKLYDIDNNKYSEVIRNKKNTLDKLELFWGDIENDLLERANKCYSAFFKKVKEDTNNIIERLQFEAGHATMPEKWWNEDYPYRLKVELANMSVGLDNVISRIISTDTRWFNQVIDQRFKTFVQIDDVSVTEKGDYTSEKSSRKIEFENIRRQQNIARLGTTAICIASYFTPLGFLGSMGFGAVGATLQSKFTTKKIEEQKELLKENIAKDIPAIIDRAIGKSEGRIKAIYDSILQQSSQKKELWREAQSIAIESENEPKTKEQQIILNTNLSTLEVIKEKLN